MESFSAGWEALCPLERLEQWFDACKPELRGHIREYHRLMENFCISCTEPDLGDYLNFVSDVRDYSPVHQALLCEGFFAMYNTSPARLVRAWRESDPRRN